MCVISRGCVIWVAVYSFAYLVKRSTFQACRHALGLHSELVYAWTFIKVFFLMFEVLSMDVTSFLRNQSLVNIDSCGLIFIIWHDQCLSFCQLHFAQIWMSFAGLSLRWNYIFWYYHLPLNLRHANFALLVATTAHHVFSIYMTYINSILTLFANHFEVKFQIWVVLAQIAFILG